MHERLGYRLAGSVLVWDLVLMLICLYGSSFIRLRLKFGNYVTPEQVLLPC